MRISFIGSGNIATHLAQAFFQKHFEIVDIYSLQLENAHKLAQIVNANPLDDLSKLSTDTDAFFICVPDSYIEIISKQLPKTIPHIHTSGNTNISVLQGKYNGVFYPLQTFSKEKKVEFEDMNILIESENEEFFKLLNQWGNELKANLFEINSSQRQKLHLAAVFACNFSNLMVNFAEEILNDHGLEKAFILPLLKETSEKFMSIPAEQAQTGPAKRGDLITINKHAQILDEFDPTLKNIYLQLTEEIQKRHGKL